MMKKFKKNLIFYLLIFIVMLAAILRIYNFPYRYSLGEETVRDAVIGIEAARQLQLPLTGSFSSLGPFTFGPWYAYQLAFFTLIFPHNYSPWIYLSLVAVLYIIIIYKIGEILKDKKFGLLLALLAALSPAQIISATHLTSHNMTNIFAITALWIFLKLATKTLSLWWAFALGFIIGIGANLHYQMAGLFILPLCLFLYKRERRYFFHLIMALLGAFITFIPLLIFELNNHWFNVRNMIYYMLYGKNAIYVPNRWLFYIRDFWPSFWADVLGIPVLVAQVIIIGFSMLTTVLILKRKISPIMFMLLLTFLFYFVIFRYYWGERFFGYFNFLRPFVFIFTGFTFMYIVSIGSRLFTRKNSKSRLFPIVSTMLLIGLFLFFATPKISSQLKQDPFSTYMYHQMEIVENKFPGKKFSLYTCLRTYGGPQPNSVPFSTLFILDLRHKFDKEGTKLGFKTKECYYPKNNFFDEEKATPSAELVQKIFPTLNDAGIIDVSNASESALLEAGWNPVSFNSIYESSTRWWFREQP